MCGLGLETERIYTEIYIRLLTACFKQIHGTVYLQPAGLEDSVSVCWKLQSMGKANKAEWFSVDVFLVGCGSERCKMEGIYIEIGGGGAQWG